MEMQTENNKATKDAEKAYRQYLIYQLGVCGGYDEQTRQELYKELLDWSPMEKIYD